MVLLAKQKDKEHQEPEFESWKGPKEISSINPLILKDSLQAFKRNSSTVSSVADIGKEVPHGINEELQALDRKQDPDSLKIVFHKSE